MCNRHGALIGWDKCDVWAGKEWYCSRHGLHGQNRRVKKAGGGRASEWEGGEVGRVSCFMVCCFRVSTAARRTS
jgi:hypothetical protein